MVADPNPSQPDGEDNDNDQPPPSDTTEASPPKGNQGDLVRCVDCSDVFMPEPDGPPPLCPTCTSRDVEAVGRPP